MAENKSGEFERSIERLEQIVAQLERGDAGLDDSVKLFREGRELAKRCAQLLETAQATIEGADQEAPAAAALRPGELPF
jgi:exodeoxyribonuclease VII small subunit